MQMGVGLINAALEEEPPFTSPQDYDDDDDEEEEEVKLDYDWALLRFPCVLKTKECLALIGGDNNANNSTVQWMVVKSSSYSTFEEMKCETQTTLIKPPIKWEEGGVRDWLTHLNQRVFLGTWKVSVLFISISKLIRRLI